MGIVGAGFVGPHHVDAVRRLGYVDVVAVAGSSEASADRRRTRSRAAGLRQLRGAARRSRRAGRAQRDAELPALPGQRRPHRQGQARRLRQAAGDDGGRGASRCVDQANKAGVVHAVTFNYRGNPLVQQARHAIARGEIGTPTLRARPLPAGLAAQGHRLLVAARARQGRRSRPRSATSDRTGATSRST